MSTQSNIEERLWDYIDGLSSAEERSVIEQLLQTDQVWKSKYGELVEVSQLLRSSELETPSLRFSKNVMEEIAKLHIAPATRSYINKKVVWGLGIFFITMMAAFLIYGFVRMSLSDGGDTVVPKNLGKFDFSKLDFSKFFSNTWVNALMIINVVLGLFLLDNYLSNKRKQYRKEA